VSWMVAITGFLSWTISKANAAEKAFPSPRHLTCRAGTTDSCLNRIDLLILIVRWDHAVIWAEDARICVIVFCMEER
jgi:hypothetical protein